MRLFDRILAAAPRKNPTNRAERRERPAPRVQRVSSEKERAALSERFRRLWRWSDPSAK